MSENLSQSNSPEKMSPDVEERRKALENLEGSEDMERLDVLEKKIAEAGRIMAEEGLLKGANIEMSDEKKDKYKIEVVGDVKSDEERESDVDKFEETDEFEGQDTSLEDKVDDDQEKSEMSAEPKEKEREVTNEQSAESESKITEKQPQPEKPVEKKRFVNKVEKKDKYKDLNRHKVAEMILSGKSDEEIWEAAKEHGYFFKFDGASYYLGNNGSWRNRSAKGNTSGGVGESTIKKRIKKQIENYRDLNNWFDDIENAFKAADILHANNIKGKAYMNKIGPMSKYWDSIEKTFDAEEQDTLTDNRKIMNPEKFDKESADSEGQESSPEISNAKVEGGKKVETSDEEKAAEETGPDSGTQENAEAAEEITAGDEVYYMEKEMRRWRDPKEVVEIKMVEGEGYAKFADEDSLFPLSKLKKVEDTNTEKEEYQPGPKNFAPKKEDLESAPDAEELNDEIRLKNLENLSVSENTAEKFKSRFGITVEELKSIEGFPDDPAKQRWVFENLTQLTMGRIESEAEKRREQALDATIPDEWKSDAGGRLKNLMNSIKAGSVRFQEGLEKKNHTATFKKEILEEIENGGIQEHGSVIQELVTNLNDSEFSVRINEVKDELEFDFISVPEDATRMQEEAIRNYNEVATMMTNTPREWQYDSATRSQRKQYEKVKEQYEVARENLAKLKLDEGEMKGDELAVAQYLNEKDFGVEMNQLLNTNPELGDKIEKISDQSVWWQTIKGGFNKKNALNALIGAGGFATRWATAAGTFGFGAAASGAAVGALRGRIEAGRKIRKKEEGARYGGLDSISGIEDLTKVQGQITAVEEDISAVDNDEKITELKNKRRYLFGKRDEILKRPDIRRKLYEAGAFVNAKDLIEKFERDISLVEDSDPDSNQRENRLRSLDARAQYVVNKLDNGIVNFGSDPKDIAVTKMNLMKLLSQAEVTTETYSEKWSTTVFEEWTQRVGLKDEKEIRLARSAFKDREMIRAGAVSGSFFAGGYFARVAGETFGLWGGESAVDSISSEAGKGVPGGVDADPSVESSQFAPAGADSVEADTSNIGSFEEGLKTAVPESTATDSSRLDEINFPDSDTVDADTSSQADNLSGGGMETATDESVDTGAEAGAEKIESLKTDIMEEIEKRIAAAEADTSQSTGDISLSKLKEIQEYIKVRSDQDLFDTLADMKRDDEDLMKILNEIIQTSEDIQTGPLGVVEADPAAEAQFDTDMETTAADSTKVDTTERAESVTDVESADVEAEVSPEIIGMQEIVIDEDGEGMIHAIADKLEAEFEVPRDKAMRISNELYIKGEQAGDTQEMYNLIGKDATFSLDFGDVTATDLGSESPEDLAQRISFSQESVKSDIKGLDLPEKNTTPEPVPDRPDGATNPNYGEESPIKTKDVDPVTIDEANQASRDAWRKQAEDAGVVFGDNIPEPVESSVDNLRSEVAQSNITKEITSELDTRINYARMRASSTSGGIRVSELVDLKNYLEASSDNNLIDSIDSMRKDNPRMLRTLDQVIGLENHKPDSLMQKIDRYISTGLGDMTIEADTAPVDTPSPEVDEGSVRQELEGQDIQIDDPEIEVRTTAEEVATDTIESLKSEVDRVSVDKLEAMATHMSAQAYVEPDFIDVPAERINNVEDFLEENSTRSTSDILMKMRSESPERMTAFERIMNLDDSGDIIDRKSLRPVYKMTQELVSSLTDDDFPDGIPKYARQSIDASIDATRA